MIPQVIKSRLTLVPQLKITGAAGYAYFPVYSLIVPALLPTHVVDIRARFEVTNPQTYNVQIGTALALGAYSPSGVTSFPNYFDETAPPSATNDTPAQHHWRDDLTALDTGRSGDVTYTLIMWAASTSVTANATIVVEQPYYGGIEALVFRG